MNPDSPDSRKASRRTKQTESSQSREPDADAPPELRQTPDAAPSRSTPDAPPEGVSRRRIVPIPAEGPIVYVSYAYADAPRVEQFVNTLRESGIRAQCDSLGFIDDEGGPTSDRYDKAINRSDYFISFVTGTYSIRAQSDQLTGVVRDLAMLARRVLENPHVHQTILLVFDGEDQWSGEMPVVFLGATRKAVSFRYREMDVSAGRIAAFLASRPKPEATDTSGFHVARTAIVDNLLDIAAFDPRDPLNTAITPTSLINAFLEIAALAPDARNSATWFWNNLSAKRQRQLSRATNRSPAVRSRDKNRSSADSPYHLASADAASLLAWAALYSQEDQDAESIWGTHMLAAVLHADAPWTSEVESALIDHDLDPKTIREAFASALPNWGTHINPESLMLWKGESPTRSQPSRARGTPSSTTWSTAEGTARLSADDPSAASNLDPENDHLGVDPDVVAFARVAASWDLTPPLAIGLFGDWGSGKTFFMKRMKSHIEKNSKKARDDTRPQRDLEYCKYVVQIEFNAWHYSEGDLWACLVDHIFTNLRLSDNEADSEVARRVKTMLTEMQSLNNDGVAAKARDQAMDLAVKQASEELNAAKQHLADAQGEYTAASVRDIWESVWTREVIKGQVTDLLKDAGIDTESIETAEDLKKVAEEARSLAAKAGNVLRYVRSQWKNPYAYIAIALAVVLPALIITLTEALSDPAHAVVEIVVASLSALSGGAVICRAILRRISEVVELVDKPRRVAEEARRLELQAAERKIKDLTERRIEAERHSIDIKFQKQELQKRIDAVNATRLLTEFLQDRAGTDDYRKRLGTLALIRRDFERLSNLMSEQRREAMKEPEAKHGTPSAPQPDDKYQVNRIVLYIDDLDRCAPAKVVEVLQAIHLLLAFPLFVVVVGVDARWVQRSIKHRYGELLRNKKQENGEGPQDEFHIDPRNYLEKIFQVPFWLPPLHINHCYNLMDGILKADVAAAADPSPKQPASQPDTQSGSNANDAATGTNSGEPAHTATKGSAAGGPSPATDPSSGSGTPIQPQETPAQTGNAHTQTNTEKGRDKDTTPVVAARSVAITSGEAQLMKRFAPIVGTSPRSVKRFINCYRLFKAVVPGGHTDKPSDIETNLSMFFLAVVVGAPDLFGIIHRTIASFDNATPTIDQVRDRIGEQIRSADPRIDGPAIAQWERVKPVLEVLKKEEAETKLHNIAWIIDRARRFGYDTSMSPTPPTPTPGHEDPMDARARAAPPPA
ncbi:MAG: hypothetical protein KF838_12640 [Phycisphaeraceae bacterium]|nr:MAG: hypothetical protein KF838_12640 [Phycisphaeraceae bacterium]